MSADDKYEQQNDYAQGADVPSGDFKDDSYVSRTGQRQVPVQRDDAPVEDPIDANQADSDEMLARDEQDAMDKSNIIDQRTRGIKTKPGTYAEPGDEEGLPGPDDGRSAIRQ